MRTGSLLSSLIHLKSDWTGNYMVLNTEPQLGNAAPAWFLKELLPSGVGLAGAKAQCSRSWSCSDPLPPLKAGMTKYKI